MKKAKLMLSALIAGLFLLAAGGSEDTEKPLYDDETAIELTFGRLIKKHLRDPDSYEFESMRPGSAPSLHMWYITYRAKNGFGGYNKATAVVVCDSTKMTLISAN